MVSPSPPGQLATNLAACRYASMISRSRFSVASISVGLPCMRYLRWARSSSVSRRGRKPCRRGDAGFEALPRSDRDFQRANTEGDHMTYLLDDLVCDRM